MSTFHLSCLLLMGENKENRETHILMQHLAFSARCSSFYISCGLSFSFIKLFLFHFVLLIIYLFISPIRNSSRKKIEFVWNWKSIRKYGFSYTCTFFIYSLFIALALALFACLLQTQINVYIGCGACRYT